jgi:hypothetical protein
VATKNKDLDTLVQYTAEKLTTYIEMPKDQRKELRKQQAMRREPWGYRWFGLLPYSTMQGLRSVQKKFRVIKKKMVDIFRVIE